MSSCHEMKKGEVYGCPGCGLELQVVAECTECTEGGCECDGDEEACDISCCGHALVKK